MKRLIYYNRCGLENLTGAFIDTSVANTYSQIVGIVEYRVEIHKWVLVNPVYFVRLPPNNHLRPNKGHFLAFF